MGTDGSGLNLKFWPKAAAGEATESEWKEFVKVRLCFFFLFVSVDSDLEKSIID